MVALSGGALDPLLPAAGAADARATIRLAAAPEPDPAARPVNVDLDLAILRHRPGTPVTDEQIAACQDFEQLHRLLRTSGRPEILHHARQHVVCQPAARVRFAAGESRTAFPRVAGAEVPPPRAYGVELAIDLHVIGTDGPESAASGALALALAWSGSWSGSTQLLSRWEALALRGFNLARTVPGVTYEKSEPDEDGFVNTSGSTDVSRFFRRRRKDKAGDRKPAPAASKAGAPAAAPGASTENEPSYFNGTGQERVQFVGDSLASGPGLVVRRESLPSGPNAGQIFLVLAPVIRP